MMHNKFFLQSAIGVLISLAVTQHSTFAAPTYPGCPAISDADFSVEVLTSNATDAKTSEPIKMAFDMDAQGNTDVYFVQRYGLLRKYDAIKKTVVDLASFPVTTQSSDGLNGIALDPNFKTTHWIYLFYTVSDLKIWRISRFKLNGETLDMNSEKVLVIIPTKGSSQHPGGAMQFDPQGNLWITSGENSIGSGGSAAGSNTADLRGKILRIKPKLIADNATLTGAGPGITYDIPDGNLFPVGTAKTLPEIYVMGSRNPYSLTLDPVRKGISWGDVGPDGFAAPTEEYDFTTKPMNGGWPFFAGDNSVVNGGGGTPAAPINPTPGNGLSALPPLTPAIFPYHESCAITGPIYYYHPSYPSPNKLPPHFDGKWLVTDFSDSKMLLLTLDAAGKTVTSSEPIFTKINLKGPLDFQAGPDGVLYVVNYAGYRSTTAATGILKIKYTGSCHPNATQFNDTTLKYLTPGPTGIGHIGSFAANNGFHLTGDQLFVNASGLHSLDVHNLSGQIVAHENHQGAFQFYLSKNHKAGIYIITVTSEGRVYSVKMLRD